MFRNIRQSINQIVSFTGILQKWRKILHVTVWLFLHNNKIPKNSKLKLFCCCSLTKSYLTLCSLIDRSSPASSVLHYLLEFAQIHVHWFYDAIQPSHPLLLPSLSASIFPSIRVFSNESALHIRLPKYHSFSFSISLSKEYSGLVSFKIDSFDLAVQGTLKSLPQHHSLKASVLQHSAFFMVQLSHSYITTRKTIALTI